MFLSAATVLAAGLALSPAGSATDETRSLEIVSSQIPSFDPGSETRRFGQLDYVGGFSFTSSDRRLRGISAIRLTDGRSRFLAVTDTGWWLRGAITRDEDGRPTGFGAAEMAPIRGEDGEPQTRRKGLADAEGLAFDGDRALVSFERDHRIEAFDMGTGSDGTGSDLPEALPQPVEQPIPKEELRSNAGIETIAVSEDGARIVVVTEQSLDADGNLFAAILGQGDLGKGGGIFKVRREVPWHVTDGAFLPGGDLLLLERRYQSFGRVGMRIRRIAGETIRPGALVDGPVLIDASLAQEIDNMEGMDVSTSEDGATYISLVSDDNGNFFQRNLYLEFRLADAAAGTPSH